MLWLTESIMCVWPVSSNPPSWFCSPKQTVFELLIWNAFFLGLITYLITVRHLDTLATRLLCSTACLLLPCLLLIFSGFLSSRTLPNLNQGGDEQVVGLKPLGLPKAGKRDVGLIDMLMGLALTVLISFTAWYKYATNTVVYLAQPCHVVTV
eukprot:137287-Rhodomonas_salina.1